MGRKAALHDDETIAAGLQNAIASLAAQLRHDFPYLKTEALDLILADTHQVMYESIIEQAPVMAAAQARLGFSKLPAEIRNCIYELLLVPDQACAQEVTLSRALKGSRGVSFRIPFGEVDHKKLISPAICQVSQQMRGETLPLFYGQTTFVAYADPSELKFRLDRSVRAIRDWLSVIDQKCPKMIKNLVIRPPLPRSECATTRSGTCDRECRGWHPVSASSIIARLPQLDVKDSAIKIEFGATVKGSFWKETVTQVEDFETLEWKPFL